MYWARSPFVIEVGCIFPFVQIPPIVQNSTLVQRALLVQNALLVQSALSVSMVECLYVDTVSRA